MARPAGSVRPPSSGRKRRQEVDIFFSNIVSMDDCWLWDGYIQNAGYGSMATYRGMFLAHRWSYEYFVGSLKPKFTVDHTCHTEDKTCKGGKTCPHRLCVNPDHLEQVTRTENIQRAGLAGIALRESQKTYCPNGHSYAEHGVKYKNGYTDYGTVKYARRCTICSPQYLRYETIA